MDEGSRSGFGWREALLAAAAALVGLVTLWSSLDGELVYDDLLLIGQNAGLRSLDGLGEAWTRSHWDFVDSDGGQEVGYWRPLTASTLVLGHRLGGGDPAAFHALSLALHAVATLGAFGLGWRLARSRLVAGGTALLFAVHPLQVESVAWISAVNDPLQGALVLWSLFAFVGWRKRGSEGLPLASVGLAGLALLAKESAAAVVPLALVMEAGLRGPRPFARAYLPFAALGLAYFGARVWVFGDMAAGFDRVSSHLGVPLSRALTLRAELLGGALQLLVWPHPLALFREVRPEVPITDPKLVAAFVAIALWVVALAISLRSSNRLWRVALLVPPAALLPALVSFESLGRFPLSDRFLYVPVLGGALLAALAAQSIANRGRLPARLATLALLSLAIVSVARSRERVDFWSDELTLFRESARATPESLYVQWGLGRVLLGEYRETKDLRELRAAHDAFVRSQDLGRRAPDGTPADPSILVTPDDRLQANVGYGWYFLLCALDTPNECTMDEAALVFRETAKLFPESAEARTGLGVALTHLGDYEGAEEALSEAVELDPLAWEGWHNLGQLYLSQERWSAAVEPFERALEIRPTELESLVGLGTALVEGNALAEARPILSRALSLAGTDPRPRIQLGSLAAREERYDKAVEWFDSILREDGTHGLAHLLRAKALLQLGDLPRSIGAFQEACRRMPDSFDAHYNTGVLLLRNGFPTEARPYIERALELRPDSPYAPDLRRALTASPAED